MKRYPLLTAWLYNTENADIAGELVQSLQRLSLVPHRTPFYEVPKVPVADAVVRKLAEKAKNSEELAYAIALTDNQEMLAKGARHPKKMVRRAVAKNKWVSSATQTYLLARAVKSGDWTFVEECCRNLHLTPSQIDTFHQECNRSVIATEYWVHAISQLDDPLSYIREYLRDEPTGSKVCLLLRHVARGSSFCSFHDFARSFSPKNAALLEAAVVQVLHDPSLEPRALSTLLLSYVHPEGVHTYLTQRHPTTPAFSELIDVYTRAATTPTIDLAKVHFAAAVALQHVDTEVGVSLLKFLLSGFERGDEIAEVRWPYRAIRKYIEDFVDTHREKLDDELIARAVVFYGDAADMGYYLAGGLTKEMPSLETVQVVLPKWVQEQSSEPPAHATRALQSMSAFLEKRPDVLDWLIDLLGSAAFDSSGADVLVKRVAQRLDEAASQNADFAKCAIGLVDNWDGTLGELITTALSLAQ